MESSLLTPLEPTVKEELGLTSSASSSSRLNNLSSSSRRLRHISPPPVSRQPAQKKRLETNQSLLSQKLQSNFSELFHLPFLLIFNDPLHHTSPKSTSTRAYKATKAIFLIWIWFCLAYFSVSVFYALRLIASGWYDSHSVGTHFISPESILATLPLDHRLSKLSSLYPIPISLQPFVRGPHRHHGNGTVACLWTDESDLSQVINWAASWKGPISLLVTSPAKPDSPSHKILLSKIASISQVAPGISFHLLYTPSSLRNYNAYINLARLFSPNSKVLLFPPSSIALWVPRPQASATLLKAVKTDHVEFMIPMRPTGTSNGPNTDMSSNAVLSSSALLLDRDSSPWCIERLFTIAKEMSSGGEDGPSAADIEMAYHWQECVWNLWLRSVGGMQMLRSERWTVPEGISTTLQPNLLPETVETNLRARLARKQRSDTCILVARELIASGLWFQTVPMHRVNEGSILAPKGDEDAENGQVPTAAEAGDMAAKQYSTRTESSQAAWLRSVCRETLERWGKELIMD